MLKSIMGFFLVLYVNHVECCNQIQGAAWRSGLRLTRNMEVVGFFEQETLPLLLSTGWFQERIRA